MSALEMKDVIDMHLAEKETIEDLLPANIVIGPFHVQTEAVRQNLSKKRKALSIAVLDLLVRKLRTQSDEVLFTLHRCNLIYVCVPCFHEHNLRYICFLWVTNIDKL